MFVRHASGGSYANAGESFVTGKSCVEPTVDDKLNYAHGLNTNIRIGATYIGEINVWRS
jgi:hypothetical protein